MALICLSLPFLICSAHEDVQSLMRSTSSTVTRSARRYADSLQCMLSSVSTLPLESLLPIIASVVLHLFVPLLYFRFAESRTALCWFAVCFALSHALYHFTPLSIGEAVSLSRMCALLPMTFELWMSAGQWLVAERQQLSRSICSVLNPLTASRC